MIQPLPDRPLDLVGDVHGELGALLNLLSHLGYRRDGSHPEDRRLVFVGDLCDRGPDSPGVIALVRSLVERGVAQAVLGNHELNLLRNESKDGMGWWNPARRPQDRHYGAVAQVIDEERQGIRQFLSGLPVALQRDDLRVVHAAWSEAHIAKVAAAAVAAPELDTAEHDRRWDAEWHAYLSSSGAQLARERDEQQWAAQLEDPSATLPVLRAIAETDLARQRINPLKLLTSGVERAVETPFYAGHKWRFSQRVTWWESYTDAVPVVVGHYWRLPPEPAHLPHPVSLDGLGDELRGIAPTAWHGRRSNVFCIDYAVGARYRERAVGHDGRAPSRFALGALRWPEREVVLDSGQRWATLQP